MPREVDLYEPVRNALLKRFKEKGKCHIEVTATKISEEIKSVLPEDSVYILLAERRRPDLIGVISNLLDSIKRWFIVEVKTDWLSFNDLYQTKKYAEMLNADWAFLISPKGFRREKIIFMKRNWYMLGYKSGSGHITTMTITEEGELNFVKELKGANPFEWP